MCVRSSRSKMNISWCSWFKTMLSSPRASPPNKLARLHEVTGWLIYTLAGLSMLSAPILWQVLVQAQFTGRAEGYFRLTGVEVMAVGFNYVIIGRASFPLTQGLGHILSSVPERFLLVNGSILLLTLREMIPTWFGVIFMLLDTSLSVVTLLVWWWETEHASAARFFREISKPFLIPYSTNHKFSSIAVLLVGMFQFVIGLTFTISSDIIHNVLRLDEAEGYALGFLGTFFFASCVNGYFHVYMGKAESLAFNIGAVFYRLVVVIPATIILFAVDKIELSLCLFIVIVQFVFVMAILMPLCLLAMQPVAADTDKPPVKSDRRHAEAIHSKYWSRTGECSTFSTEQCMEIKSSTSNHERLEA